MATPRICSVAGCSKPLFCRGWCSPHYQRWRKHGDPLGGRHFADNSGPCAAEGCERGAKIAGYCKRHHHKVIRYGDPLGGAPYRRGEQDEWIEAHLGWDSDDCLIWPFSVAPNGYGVVSREDARGAHRVMCILAHGEAPSPAHQTAHSCNVRRCVNPRHLRWATVRENAADKVVHGTHGRGPRNPNAKLTESEARKILDLRGTLLLREVAERFGVSITTAHRIQQGRAWAWLSEASKPK